MSGIIYYRIVVHTDAISCSQISVSDLHIGKILCGLQTMACAIISIFFMHVAVGNASTLTGALAAGAHS